MSNFEIKEDEVILYEARLSGSLLGLNNSIYLTLTSKRIIIEEITKKSGLLNKKDEKKLFEEIELKDTTEMMNSADYKERFKAEYYQNVIRYQKLKNMLDKWDKGELNFEPTCPRSTYNMQIKAMTDYIAVLEARAVMEGVDL